MKAKIKIPSKKEMAETLVILHAAVAIGGSRLSVRAQRKLSRIAKRIIGSGLKL